MSCNLSKIINIFLIIGAVCFEFNCGSSFRVQYDYVENQDFEHYKTFDFMATPNALQVNDKSVRRVKKAVSTELEKAGFEIIQKLMLSIGAIIMLLIVIIMAVMSIGELRV